MVVREREDGGCYVDGFADEAAELTARGSVLAGDHILAVGGNFIDGKGQRHLRELLKAAPNPVVLLLRREPTHNPNANTNRPLSSDHPATMGRSTDGQLASSSGLGGTGSANASGDRSRALGNDDDDAGSGASVDSYGSRGENAKTPGNSIGVKRPKAVDHDILMSIKAAAAAAQPPSPADAATSVAGGSGGKRGLSPTKRTGAVSGAPNVMPPGMPPHAAGAAALGSQPAIVATGYSNAVGGGGSAYASYTPMPYAGAPAEGGGHVIGPNGSASTHRVPPGGGGGGGGHVVPQQGLPPQGLGGDPYAAAAGYPHHSYLQGPRPPPRRFPHHGHAGAGGGGGYPHPSSFHHSSHGVHHPGGPPASSGYRGGPPHQQAGGAASFKMVGGRPQLSPQQHAGGQPTAMHSESARLAGARQNPTPTSTKPRSSSNAGEDRRFGLGPLNVVLERARSDVDALFRAYEANAFTRWQLKMALKERTPTLDGNAPRVLKQGGAAPTRVASDGRGGTDSTDGGGHPRARGSPEEKQRMLMLMLAHDISPMEICESVLKRDKSIHLCRDKLVASQGYWVAISQERMRDLYQSNKERRVYVYFEKDEVSPLPKKFTESGFARTRATMNIDRKSNGTTLRAQVQRVQFSFSSPNHPDEDPLVVEYDLYHTKPYLDLLGIEQKQQSSQQSIDSQSAWRGDSPSSSSRKRLPSSEDVDEADKRGEDDDVESGIADEEDEGDSDSDGDPPSASRKQQPSSRRPGAKKARLTNGTRHPGGQLAILDSLATQAASAPRASVDEVKGEEKGDDGEEGA